MTQAANTNPGRGLTVLAVDDERPALDELAFLLRRQDAVAAVFTAQDATTALRQIQNTVGPGQPVVDAVFLDINMPGLDGLELAGILSAFARPPAVVFVTAHDDRALAAFDLGAVDYLLKPVEEDRLADALDRARTRLSEKRGREEAEKLKTVLAEVAPDAMPEIEDEGEQQGLADLQ